jgi:hypothetical protein
MLMFVFAFLLSFLVSSTSVNAGACCCCCCCCVLQDQGGCSACVGFAVTAAAEAAINTHKQQNWDKLGLSEQDLSFCKCAGF